MNWTCTATEETQATSWEVAVQPWWHGTAPFDKVQTCSNISLRSTRDKWPKITQKVEDMQTLECQSQANLFDHGFESHLAFCKVIFDQPKPEKAWAYFRKEHSGLSLTFHILVLTWNWKGTQRTHGRLRSEGRKGWSPMPRPWGKCRPSTVPVFGRWAIETDWNRLKHKGFDMVWRQKNLLQVKALSFVLISEQGLNRILWASFI